jgi:DUF438 domain-containing protein
VINKRWKKTGIIFPSIEKQDLLPPNILWLQDDVIRTA